MGRTRWWIILIGIGCLLVSVYGFRTLPQFQRIMQVQGIPNWAAWALFLLSVGLMLLTSLFIILAFLFFGHRVPRKRFSKQQALYAMLYAALFAGWPILAWKSMPTLIIVALILTAIGIGGWGVTDLLFPGDKSSAVES